MPFSPGDRVETLSGQSVGTVEAIAETGEIDVRHKTGFLFRNCIPSMWRLSNTRAEPVKPAPLTRSEPCHVVYHFEGEYWQRNGYIIGLNPSEIFIMFCDSDSAWVSRDFVVRGHGDHPF